MDPITAAFLGGLAKSVPGLVSDWVKTRQAIRIEYTRARITENAEQARYRRWERAQEYNVILASYPLGIPGRLRTLYRMPGQLPMILISPLPPGAWPSLNAIPERVQELLGATGELGLYARTISGAFARDGGTPRFIDGEVVARTIAEYEFCREPAVMIYFEPGPRALTAVAYLSTIFGSVGGESSFSFVIARYVRDQASTARQVTPLGGDLPAWRLINLSAPGPLDASDVVAQTITWFLLAVIDAYWQQRGRGNPGLLSAARAGAGMGYPGAASVAAPAASGAAHGKFLGHDADLHGRLEWEARQLAGTGFQVTAEELRDGYVGLHVKGSGKDVVFVVGGDYPDAPPVAIRAAGTPIEIDSSDWSPECTLTDVVEAIP